MFLSNGPFSISFYFFFSSSFIPLVAKNLRCKSAHNQHAEPHSLEVLQVLHVLQVLSVQFYWQKKHNCIDGKCCQVKSFLKCVIVSYLGNSFLELNCKESTAFV